jgi:AraC-like DNA-binding protein
MNIIIPGILLCGILIILVLWAYGSRNNSNNKILAISLFFVWYILLINHLNIQGTIIKFPHLSRTALIPGYLAVPFLYIYIRNTFYPGRIWQSRDWMFLLLPVFYIIDLAPFFILPGAEKEKMFSSILKGVRLKMQISEGWLTPVWMHYALLYSVSGVLMALIIIIIIKNQKLENDRISTTNKPLYGMLIMLAISYSIMTFPGLIGSILGVDWFNMHFISVSLSIPFLGVFIFLIFSPHVLYGFLYKPAPQSNNEFNVKDADFFFETPDSKEAANEDTKDQSEIEIQASKKYSNYQIEVVFSKLNQFMIEKKPFLKKSLLIHELSKELNVPAYMLSKVINQKIGTNFNKWINSHRVEYFLKLYQDPENQQLTLEALAQKAGFLSRVTFINSFKAEKNETPTQYIKTQFKREVN